MATDPPPATRPFSLEVGALTLSGLLAEPAGATRGLILAIHGHGMRSAYFAGPADLRLSLLELGAATGFTVWAPDRPGYGTATEVASDDHAMRRQAELLLDALDAFAKVRDTGAGCVLLGHSFGLKVAFAMASQPRGKDLLGVEGSGAALRYTWRIGVDAPPAVPGDKGYAWGPAGLYPPRTFERGIAPVATMPAESKGEGAAWPDDFRELAPRITVPVRISFGDHERLIFTGPDELDELRALFPASPRVEVGIHPGAGHNISLARSARAYHLKALAFAEECILATEQG